MACPGLIKTYTLVDIVVSLWKELGFSHMPLQLPLYVIEAPLQDHDPFRPSRVH